MLHDLVNFALGLASLALSGLVIRVYHYFDAMEARQEENEELLFTIRADLISFRRECGSPPYPYDRPYRP